jgi:hypothetical protein
MDNPQVIECHPYRPISTAVLKPANARDEHPLCPDIGIAFAKKCANEFTLMRDPRIKGSPVPYPPKQGKLDSGDQQLKSGKPGARWGQIGVLLSSHAVSLWPDGSNQRLATLGFRFAPILS